MLKEPDARAPTSGDADRPWSWTERLEPTYVAKPWGRTDIPDAPPEALPLGEIIYRANGHNLIVKWLHTAEPLSVQVHPRTRRRKHEWWHVIDARPGAYIDLGVSRPCTRDELAAAARAGSLPDLLNRIEPRTGDNFYIEAGTIHALGPGLTILEIQEDSDVTYRLFDYGRPRELHLEQGLAEAITEPQPIAAMPGPEAPFSLAPLRLDAGEKIELNTEGAALAVLTGEGTLAGRAVNAGQCWLADGALTITADAPMHLFIAEPRPPRPTSTE